MTLQERFAELVRAFFFRHLDSESRTRGCFG